MNAQREAVLQEARRWIGTPYHHCADIHGVGVDCLMLLVKVYGAALGIVVKDPRPYSPDWFLHRSEEIYKLGIMKHCREVKTPLPGDIALFKFGRCASHASIIVDETYHIHAHRLSKMVELGERRAIDDKLDSYWSPFNDQR
jgi:NlpC/P60 family putative phage cell wall peptidase